MSRRFSSNDGSLFIGRLSKSCRVRDLEDVFEPYGRMSRCEIKYGAEMAYGFVDYEDRRDADDAVRYENGREVAGSAIIVEWAKGAPRRSGEGGSEGGRGGGRGGGGRGDGRGDAGGRDMRDSGRNKGQDECYRCRKSGHWARDCPDDRNYGFRRPNTQGQRDRSPPPRRRRSYDRKSRSRSPRDRRRSNRSRSRSNDRKSPSRSRSRSPVDRGVNGGDRSRSRSVDRERSPTP